MLNAAIPIQRLCLYAFVFLTGGNLFATTFTLTLQTNGTGSGTIGANPSLAAYPANSVVTVTATPGASSYFAGWGGNASGTVNPLNVQMTNNLVVSGIFLPIPTYSLTTVTNGQGTIGLSPSGGTYASNTVVTLTATPAAGWIFLNWSGAVTGVTTNISITVTNDESVTANFAELPAITQAPQDTNAAVGSTISFSIQAAGTAPLSYSWLFNNMLQPSSTNVLTLTNVQLSQAGTYWVIVSNAYGVVSNSAVLTITNVPTGTNVVATADENALVNAINIGGTVTFGFNGTILLTNPVVVTNNVTLDATGRSVEISGGNSVQLFQIESNVTFSATNLVFANGTTVGANGTNSTTGQPGQAGFPAGGGAIIDTGGAIQLTSCIFSNNSAHGGNGGSSNGSSTSTGGAANGGAIFVAGGTLFLQSVTLENNFASGGAGGTTSLASPPGLGGNGYGGAIFVTNGNAALVNCLLSNNYSISPAGGVGEGPSWGAAFGGALCLSSGNLVVSNCILFSNAADGGTAPVNQLYFIQPAAAYGGAMAVLSGTANIALCKVTSNSAFGGNAYRYSGTGEAQGGGVYSGANLTVANTAFTGNRALSGSYSSINTDGRGGGLYNFGNASVNSSTFNGNLAVGGNAGAFGVPSINFPGGNGLGGGICNVSQLAMTNCTIALNTAEGGAGSYSTGVPGNGVGGGLCNSNGTFFGMNITVASGSVVPGSGYQYQGTAAGAEVANLGGVLALENSIIAYPNGAGNASGTITDAGYNISSDGSANFASGTSFNFTDPLLSSLQWNGGPTLTMALSPDSPAIDFGTTIGAPSADQRGLPRPSGPGVDIGAYEFQQGSFAAPTLAITGNPPNLFLSFAAQSNALYFLQNSPTPSGWTLSTILGPYSSNGIVTVPINSSGTTNDFFRLLVQ